MSKINQRTLVHIALNANGERVGFLVSGCGGLIGFSGTAGLSSLMVAGKRSASYWNANQFICELSLKSWKTKKMKLNKAVRFQRVMVVGN